MKGDAHTHGLWEASAPAAPTTAPLYGHIKADVVIVGGGYTGLSAALYLAEAGIKAVVLESTHIGFGGSGRNVGLVNAGMWVMPSALPGALGDTYGPRLLKQLGNAPALVAHMVDKHGIDCQLVRNGTLHCAADGAGLANLRDRARQWGDLGAPVRLLDARETAAKVGTSAYLGALLDMRAATIQPLAYARGLAVAAARAGADLYTQSPVISVKDQSSSWRVVTAQGATVEAPWVIVATNAYTDAGGLWPELAEELVRLPYFNLATAPLDEKLAATILPERQGAWDTQDVLTSFRFDRESRLVFGSVGALRGTGKAVHSAWGRRAMAKLFPQLKGVGFEHEWYGTIGMTANSLPRFHELARNTVSISGYNGRGIAPGTTFGRDLARLVSGEIKSGALSLPASQPNAVTFKAVREAMYEVGSQAVHLMDARI